MNHAISVDINEKVLAAFQAEHKEQLEGIRAVLFALESDETRDRPEHIDEAFRLAHSLKGGARVCDLRPAETLAHRLESVFEELRGGNLNLDEDAVKAVNTVLDAIEDWMAALARGESPMDPDGALTVVERLLNSDSRDGEGAPVADGDVAKRLVNAFFHECPQYVAGLRQFAAILDDQTSAASADDVEEAFRLAHNLRGSTQAAEIDSMKNVADALESLIAGIRDQTTIPDAAASEPLRQHLDTIDFELAGLADSCRIATSTAHPNRDAGTATEFAFDASQTEKTSSSEPAMPAASARNLDTVRISTESLDRLLRTSRQLVAESAGQEQVSRELEDIRRQVNQMERERESIRRLAAASLQQLTTMPEFNRLASYFEFVDHGVQSLVRSARQLCAVQKRTSWLLQSRGRQIQQDVRRARMVPAEAVYQGLRKLVRDLASEEGKQVDFRVTGFEVRADRMVFQTLKDPLIHILRNCIVHGIEPPSERTRAGKSVTCHIHLRIETVGNRLTIEVDDDGRGIDRDKIARRAVERGFISPADIAERSSEEIENLIFQPGFSTSDQVTEIAGRGMGLSVVRDAVTRLQGDVQVCRNKQAGTKFRVVAPLCIATHRLLLVSAAEQTYAIPLHAIQRLLQVKPDDMETMEGKPVVTFENRPVPVVGLTSALGLGSASLKVNSGVLQIAILKSNTRHVAVSVDAFVAERDLLIQDLDEAAACKAYLGAILLDDGNVALVLNPVELLERARPEAEQTIVEVADPHAEKRTPRVLVVDDSFTTRTLEKSILEANGYEVGIAVDGVEGLNRLKSEHYDLVISDVEMPRMDGFELLEEIKKDHRLASTPVVLVTSRSHRDDQAKGLDLGAEAYIVKQRFDHESLLSTIRQIVGGEL